VAIARSPLSRRGSRGPPTPNSCRLRPATHIWSPVSWRFRPPSGHDGQVSGAIDAPDCW